MSPIVGLLVLIVLFLVGFPVPYAIAAGSIIIMALSTGMKWMSITSIMIGGVNSFTILCIPLFLLAGMLITGSAAVSILAPIFLPVAVGFGIDPIHLGVIMIVNLAIGYITPPVGVNLYLSGGVAKVSIEDLVKENMPFLIATLVVLVIVNLVPAFSLWIPSFVK